MEPWIMQLSEALGQSEDLIEDAGIKAMQATRQPWETVGQEAANLKRAEIIKQYYEEMLQSQPACECKEVQRANLP